MRMLIFYQSIYKGNFNFSLEMNALFDLALLLLAAFNKVSVNYS